MTRTAITRTRVIPIAGDPFEGTVLLDDGRILAAGPDVAVPDGFDVVDGSGRWLVPGFVDAHTHLGVHEEGEGWAGNDTNEMTDPVTAAARALDAINPYDRGFDDALTGGVTAVNVNPGSGNPIGGLTVAVRTHGRTVDEMVLRSPSGLKSALGENPKRVYGDKKQMPSTRLGTALIIRKAFTEAQGYLARRAARANDGSGEAKEPLATDLTCEALGLVLSGEIPWRQHSHRLDDIATAIRIAEEFGYRLVLDHGTESHLIADVLAAKSIPVLYGPLIISRVKVETRERTLVAPGLLHRAGVAVSIITDHPVVPIDHLVTQAALCVKEGMPADAALRAITLNPARVMGVDDRIGSIEPGKDADLVLWSGDPFVLSSRALQVWIRGRSVYSYREDERRGVIGAR
jgi:imidazolonepropionase-like amidohydrolase